VVGLLAFRNLTLQAKGLAKVVANMVGKPRLLPLLSKISRSIRSRDLAQDCGVRKCVVVAAPISCLGATWQAPMTLEVTNQMLAVALNPGPVAESSRKIAFTR
jgi:hypothetical protein